MLACVSILLTTGYCWNTLEPPGTYTTLKESSWILLNVPCPHYLKCIAALMCGYPPPLSYNTFTCSGELWDVLACVGIFPTTGYYWNTLEPAGTIWNLCPQHLTCIAALMCSYPPFHTIACVGMRFSLLLDTI